MATDATDPVSTRSQDSQKHKCMLDTQPLTLNLCLKCKSPTSGSREGTFCMLIECVSVREGASLPGVDDGDSCCWTDDRSGEAEERVEMRWTIGGGGGRASAWAHGEYSKIIQQFRPALPQAAHACCVRTQEKRTDSRLLPSRSPLQKKSTTVTPKRSLKAHQQVLNATIFTTNKHNQHTQAYYLVYCKHKVKHYYYFSKPL